jgi:hypothetical protein
LLSRYSPVSARCPSAAPPGRRTFNSTTEYSNPDLVQQVRLVCDDAGRCYRTRGGNRVIVRDSYNYMPRERYIERREYRDWDDGPRAGVGIRAPGVSVGVGVGDRW